MVKKLTITTKPKKAAPTADGWVSGKTETDPMKRFTIDVPQYLHRRIKAHCALRGTKMADEIRAMLEQKFAGEIKA